MKKQFTPFLAGMLTMALIGSLCVGALAATGRMTINVDPVNIQVNGQTFKPTDAKGAEVPVFAYNGTTYAPLRALAEAYGLEVGYDSAANMATVNDPDAAPSTPNTTAPSTDYSDWSKEEEAAYQEFKGMWKVVNGVPDYQVRYSGDLSLAEFKSLWNGYVENKKSLYESFCCQMLVDICLDTKDTNGGMLWFLYNDTLIAESVVYSDGTGRCNLHKSI